MSGIKINGNLNEGGNDELKNGCLEINKMEKKVGHLGMDSEGNAVVVNGMEKNNGNGMEKCNETLIEENVTMNMKEGEKSIFKKFVNGSFLKGK